MAQPMEGVEPVGSFQQTDFEDFSPLITELVKYADKIGESFDNAELNKRICSVLFKRVNDAAGEVKILRQLKDDYSLFFKKRENYPNFYGFVKTIEKIKTFIMDVSQLQGAHKFFDKYRSSEFSMDKIFRNHIDDFEKYADALNNASDGRLNFGKSKDDQKIKDEEAISKDMQDIENVI
ncbi:11018_t:CDS:1 [Ambispora leptoticha]|uniref:11018_t:CDS:1 n=1 Tax=Ambispora leptoticha TaxID=144679 RepID=A0A9N8WCP3_9GLOM|nr:11018_t:CDS:1 [Ambispora leptoticha]